MPSKALFSGGVLILTAGLVLAIHSGRAEASSPPVQAFNSPTQGLWIGEDDSSSTPSPTAPAGASQEDGARVKALAPSGQDRANTLAFSPDGRLLAVGSSLGIYLFDASSLEEVAFIETETWVRSISFSPDGQTLVSGSYDPTVRMWRVADGALLRTLEGHSAWVRSVSFSPDGRLLATASDDNTVRVWDVLTGNPLFVLEDGTEGVRAVSFSPDGEVLATGGYDKIVRLWRVEDGALLRELRGHTDWVRSLAFSPDGTLLASGGFDAQILLWRVNNGVLLRSLTEHSASVLGLAFSTDGDLLASASVDTSVRLWSMPEGEPYDLLTGHSDFVYSIAFSPDGSTLASGAVDNTVRVWELPRQANPLAAERVTSPSSCVACHHPRGSQEPARVIETSCSVCHDDGALVLNWCPVLPRSTGETTVQVSNHSQDGKTGVPHPASDFGVAIAAPGNGEHVYSPHNILTYIPIDGYIFSDSISTVGFEVQLEIWSGSERTDVVSTKSDANGYFSFLVNVRSGGLEPLPLTDTINGQRCLACHTKTEALLPPQEVRLLVAAVAPDGRQAFDERWIYVDDSVMASLPVQVLQENGQPASNISVHAATRLYEWRGRTFNSVSGTDGEATLTVEALSQIPTTYQISAPPVVVNGVLYESVGPVEVTLPPGATSAPPVTLRVRTTSGQLSGQFTPPPASPVSVLAIHLPDGVSLRAQSDTQGAFVFPELPIGRYLIAPDPEALTPLGQAAQPQVVDLFEQPRASLDLPLARLSGASLSGAVRQPDDRPLPFAFVSLEGLAAFQPVLPDSGGFSLAGLPSGPRTLLVSAPGFYSQAHVVDPANLQPLDLALEMRPETRLLAWGAGQVVIPPETRLVETGLQLALERGWLWGEGRADQPLVLQVQEAEISIPAGKFALENVPGRAAWLYLFDGQAEIRWGEDPEPIHLEKGQMVVLRGSGGRPVPVPYDPVVVAALHPEGELPIAQTWQPTLEAQLRDRLARAGITTAQIVTFITYLMVFLSIVGAPFAGIYWWRRNRRKVSDPTQEQR